jgi:hypothetical protein
MISLKLHRLFALTTFLTILTFWTSTLITELFFDYKTVLTVKSLIVFPGLFILIPSIIITAITANLLVKSSDKIELIKSKKARMPIIGVIGGAILLPSAMYLNSLASQQLFDFEFYLFQAIELIAGATNIWLMYLNIKESRKANLTTIDTIVSKT